MQFCKMEFQEDDEFMFDAPAEEEEEIVSPPIEIIAANFQCENDAPTPNPLVQLASRIVFKQFNKSPKRQISGDGSNVLDESRRLSYVEKIVKKLDAVDSFDEPEISLPYWRTLVFLCSGDDGSNSAAASTFVKRGGIAQVEFLFHDFITLRCRETGENRYMEVITEILRCLAVVFSSPVLFGFDTGSLVDYLGLLIDLNQGPLAMAGKVSNPSTAKLDSEQAKVLEGQDNVLSLDFTAFEAALKVIYALSAHRTTASLLLKRNVVEALLSIIRKLDQERVVGLALKILTNFATPSSDSCSLILECGGLQQLFLTGAEMMGKAENQFGTDTLTLLQGIMECLANLIKSNHRARRQLTEMKGALLPNYVLAHYGKETDIYQSALNLSHALFSESAISEEWQAKIKTWSTKCESQKECAALNKLLVDALKVKGGKVAFEACLTPEMAKLAVPKGAMKAALTPTPEVQKILKQVAVPMTGGRIYMRGEKVQLAENGNWNEICDEITDLHDLKTRSIQEVCCAALNSRQRLTVYFGLEKDGRVRGISVNQAEGDEFRIGIDWSLARAFRPFLEPTMYNVEFVPVCVGENQPKPIPDLFVVELQILHITTEAYQLEKDGAVYFRINGQIVQLSLQEAAEYIAHEMDVEKKQNLLRLRREISILKTILEE